MTALNFVRGVGLAVMYDYSRCRRPCSIVSRRSDGLKFPRGGTTDHHPTPNVYMQRWERNVASELCHWQDIASSVSYNNGVDSLFNYAKGLLTSTEASGCHN